MNTLSYEKYLTSQINSIAPFITIKTYKTANKINYPIFERDKDLRIQFHHNNECIYEFIVERTFWLTSNKNKEDKRWMRQHADLKIDMVKNAVYKK